MAHLEPNPNSFVPIKTVLLETFPESFSQIHIKNKKRKPKKD